jgi:ankyrin repeat protein
MGAWPRFSILAALGLALATPAAAQFSDSYNFLQAVKSRDGQKATDILNKPSPPVDAKDSETGETALHMVVRRHDDQWLAFLLAHGASPNSKDRMGNTPLHLAAATGDTESITPLLQYGATINAVNNNGESPLILAIHAHDQAATRLLIANGADPRQRDTLAGKSAEDYAREDPRAVPLQRILADAKPKAPPKKISGPVLH